MGNTNSHHRQRDRDIDGAFEKAIERIFQRLFPQPDEAEAVVLEVRHGMAQFLLEIAHDEQPHAEMIADADDVTVDLGEERKLQHDDLRHPALDKDLFEIFRMAEHGNAVLRLLDLLVADEADGAQADIRFAPQPAPQLGRFQSRSNQNGFLLPRAGKDSPGEKLRQVVMRKKKRDIKPRDKVEEEKSRDERVLGRDQIEDQRADAGEGLAQAQPVLPEQFVLEKIIFRSVAAERFD